MELKIEGIFDWDDLNSQRIVLSALESGSINEFAIVDTTFQEVGAISNLHRHFYSFPNLLVEKGHYIVLYTKIGTNRISVNGNKTYHLLHWNLEVSVWNENDTAYLLKIAEASSKKTRKA